MSAHLTVRRYGVGPARVLLHVPHAGTEIPGHVRAGFAVDDETLAAEIDTLTDWHTDRLATQAAQLAVDGRRGSVLVAINGLSRLVVDPERLPDGADPMETVGMGQVYQRCADGSVLRTVDPRRDADLVARYFEPYAVAVADLVDQILGESGTCLIVDCHSYPSVPFSFERDHAGLRPEVCIGTDPFHTPDGLAEMASLVLGTPDWVVDTGGRTVATNTPFAGTYVPQRHLRRDRRVRSVMIEARRDTYLDGTNAWRDPDASRLARAVAGLVRFALEPEGVSATGRGTCPACGSEAVVPLVYGLPGRNAAEAAQRGEIELGGCVIGPQAPTLACRSCEGQFRDPHGTVTWPWGRPR